MHNLPSGGARRALVAHARVLASRGHGVEIFELATGVDPLEDFATLGLPLHRYQVPPPPDREAGLFGRPTVATGIKALRLLAVLPRVWRRVARDVDSGGFDVALVGNDQFTHTPHLLRYCRTPAALYSNEPLRYVYDAPVGDTPARESLILKVLRPVADRVLKRVLGSVDARNVRASPVLITNSNFSHESFLRCYGRPARVVYLGVDAQRFRPLGRSRREFVLSVGAMHPAKGFSFLVEAIALLPRERRPDLVLVSDRGYGVYRQRLEALAASRGVRLDLRHRVADGELLELYNTAAVFVYAPYLEPFGLVVLEAMACGTAVVAVAEGGVRETVRDGVTGTLVPRDPARFAAALGALLDDPDRAAQLGAAGRADAIALWTWERSTEALEAALLETAAAGRA